MRTSQSAEPTRLPPAMHWFRRVLSSCDYRHGGFGNPAEGFLGEVPRVWGVFLALLSASGTCARRARRRTRSGAAGPAARRDYRQGPRPESRDSAETATGRLAGTAGRKDRLVAT